MDCPRCKLSLVKDRYEGEEVDLCQGCWGIWLDLGELEHILESRHFHFTPEERKLAVDGRTRREQGPIEPAHCPKCTVRMERLYLDPKIYLVIDRCRKHGVWLDTGEIKTLQVMAEASQDVSRMLVRKIRTGMADAGKKK